MYALTKKLKGPTRQLFAAPCEFLAGADCVQRFPSHRYNEVAFVGRSNVGKSSLINALTGQKNLARTSKTPGRTQQINFFKLLNIVLVDLPGYGYANAPKQNIRDWLSVSYEYLVNRKNLKRIFLLIDSRHGIKTIDHEAMDLLNSHNVPFQVVLTKIDKIKEEDLNSLIQHTEQELKSFVCAWPVVTAVSVLKKISLNGLREEISRFTG